MHPSKPCVRESAYLKHGKGKPLLVLACLTTQHEGLSSTHASNRQACDNHSETHTVAATRENTSWFRVHMFLCTPFVCAPWLGVGIRVCALECRLCTSQRFDLRWSWLTRVAAQKLYVQRLGSEFEGVRASRGSWGQVSDLQCSDWSRHGNSELETLMCLVQEKRAFHCRTKA